MGRPERREDRLQHAERLPGRQRPVLAENLTQRPPLDIFHREVDEPFVGPLVEDADDVGV
jgi:hypothetical protein